MPRGGKQNNAFCLLGISVPDAQVLSGICLLQCSRVGLGLGISRGIRKSQVPQPAPRKKDGLSGRATNSRKMFPASIYRTSGEGQA